MRRPEDQIQRAVVEHLRLRGQPGLIWWHTPSGGYRRRVEAQILKGLGAKAGVPDLCFLYDGKFFALELKAPGGRPTVAQLEFISGINAAGGFAAVVVGLDAALASLQAWGLLRGSTQ